MALFSYILLAFALSFVSRWIYRLFLHPLAKYPGPKLAGMTRLYEGYYDIVLRGQYKVQVDKLHDQYGMSHLHGRPCKAFR